MNQRKVFANQHPNSISYIDILNKNDILTCRRMAIHALEAHGEPSLAVNEFVENRAKESRFLCRYTPDSRQKELYAIKRYHMMTAATVVMIAESSIGIYEEKAKAMLLEVEDIVKRGWYVRVIATDVIGGAAQKGIRAIPPQWEYALNHLCGVRLLTKNGNTSTINLQECADELHYALAGYIDERTSRIIGEKAIQAMFVENRTTYAQVC